MREFTLTARPRILLVRLSAIGDVIFALPLAAAIRKARPQAFIGWIVEEPAAALVVNNPLLDWVKVVPKKWLKRPSLVAEIRRDLQARHFDIAIDPQGLTKSAGAAWLSGAKTRVGFTRGASWELAPWLDNVKLAPQGTHVVDINLSLLRGIGLEPPSPDEVEFVLPPCGAKDEATITLFLEDLEKNVAPKGFALMGPWGTFASKLWPLDRYLELAQRLRSEYGMTSVMLGHGEKERSAVEALAAKSGGALKIAPQLSLTGVTELARRAGLFVGGDSFPTHAAGVVGCKTVGLFGVSDPERVGAYRKETGRSVFAKLTLVKSRRERSALGDENMLALSAEQAFDACKELLAL